MEKKFIVITGASSGFGAEMAKIFAKDGHNLLLLARRVEMMEALALPNAMVEKLDVTDATAFKAAIKKGEEKFGPVDLLVNNAGVMLLGEMGTQDPSQYQTMIDVNVKGVINGVEAVINSMKERKTGTIINLSSTAGLRPYGLHAVYGATKYAVRGLSDNLRMELAPHNIRVTNVCPGAFATELLGHTTSDEIIDGYEEWKKSMGKMAHPIEVAKMIKYIFDAPQELEIEEVVMYSTKQGN